VISEPVLVSNGTVSTIAKAEIPDLPNGSATPEKLREELAATKAQAAFRGYLVSGNTFFLN
jgi:hypothetical protein